MGNSNSGGIVGVRKKGDNNTGGVVGVRKKCVVVHKEKKHGEYEENFVVCIK